MLACFGPKGGSDDKQQHAAHSESAGGNLPARSGRVLFRNAIFQSDDLGPVFRSEIWRRISEEPACMRVQREQQQQVGDENEMFHCWMLDGPQASARGKRRPAAGFNAIDGIH
jgi:hypothetical protein